jgi:beta-galactosidase
MNVGAGGTATFTVAATGNGTLTYQWYVNVGACPNCSVVSGATLPTLTLTSNAPSAGNYYCIVTNTLNGTKATATSQAANLDVVAPSGSGAITADTTVLPNSAGLVASVASQPGVAYTWALSNGTVNSGQGTP